MFASIPLLWKVFLLPSPKAIPLDLSQKIFPFFTPIEKHHFNPFKALMIKGHAFLAQVVEEEDLSRPMVFA